jgi:succinate dehydrogenase / fumarate reductase flavoprotein subunit
MQGLSDGYFILPNTISHYLASTKLDAVAADQADVKQAEADALGRVNRLLQIDGKRTVASFHRELGRIMWERCGMARTAAGLQAALREIPALREEFWQNVRVTGGNDTLNQTLEHGLRAADFLELGELMCRDALHREESCGGHFREEYQTEEGEALRDDDNFAYVAAWEFTGEGRAPALHKEPLEFEHVQLAQRSYK